MLHTVFHSHSDTLEEARRGGWRVWLATLPRFFGSFENSLFLIVKNFGFGTISYIAFKSIMMKASTLAT